MQHKTRGPKKTNKFIPSRDLFLECRDHMASNQLDPDELVKADEKIHRWSRDCKKHKKDEWYLASEGTSAKGNKWLCCSYGSWSDPDSKFTYKSWEQGDPLSYDDDERKGLHKAFQNHKEEVQKRIAEEHEIVAAAAKKIWDKASETPENENQTRYLRLKGVQGHGIRYGKNPWEYDSIIIPIRNVVGEIRSLQFISVSESGESFKSFLSGGEKKGNFFQIGSITDGESFYVVEGYATGASVHEASTSPVIVAFDSGNLPSVIQSLREKYQTNEIFIAADDDTNKAGQQKAEEAACRGDRCKVVLPSFPIGKELDERGRKRTDFNDLHQACGLEEVKRQLQCVSERKVFKPLSFEDLLQMPEKEWLIKDVIGPRDQGMIYGPPGAGKTFIAVDMISCCTIGGTWASRFHICRPLNIAYCAGEGLSGLKSRFEAAKIKHNLDSRLKNFTYFNTMPQLYLDAKESVESIKNFVLEWKSNQEKGKAEPLDILFIDTFHTATIGAEENSSKDMGKALHSCRFAAAELGCAVFLIHHTNKTGTAERGSSALRGAMDVMIEIEKPSDNSSIAAMKCSKLKDGEGWENQNFALVPVDGTKSVCVDWRAPMDSSEKKGKQGKQIEMILFEMKKYPGIRFTVKQLSKVIGATENHTRNLLAKMLSDDQCQRKLKDPKKESGRGNPYFYGIE